MNKEYITIKEFADLQGVSTQAVYKQLSKNLKPYLKIIDKKKMISIKALQDNINSDLQPQIEYNIPHNNKDFKNINQPNLQPSCQPNLQPVDNQEQDLIDTLKDTLKILEAQLKVKDRQIEELNNRLAEANELNRNNQVLLKNSQEIKMVTDTIQRPKERNKVNFWDRLFSKH